MATAPNLGPPRIDLSLLANVTIELNRGYTVAEVCYDPWQLHRSATTLRQAGINMVEFPQTISNLTDIGQAIFDAVKHKTLKLYSDTELRNAL